MVATAPFCSGIWLSSGQDHKHCQTPGGDALCCAESLGRVWLSETPWTVARQALLSMGILQASILEWVAMPSSRGSSQPRDRTQVSHMAGGFFTIWATREAPRRCTTHPYTVCLLTTSKYGPHFKHHEERDTKTNGGRKGEKWGKDKEKAERQREREYKCTGQNVNNWWLSHKG